MKKVVVTKEVAEIIETAIGETFNKKDKALVLYKTLGKLNDNKIEKLENGIVTVAEAVQNGYTVVPTEFYTFKDMLYIAVTTGATFNVWDEDFMCKNYIYPISYIEGKGFVYVDDSGNVRSQPIEKNISNWNTWYIVE